jgi:hypothetical protein
MVTQFITPLPDAFQKDPDVAEYFRQLSLYLDDLGSPDGALATSEATTATVLTQQEKLDLMTISQAVDLDAVEAATAANSASIATIQSGSPDYTISNDGTDRTFNADSAAGAISTPTVAPAEVENIRDALLELADVVATIIRDLDSKGIFG